MNESTLLWPWPWWTSLLIAAAVLAIAWCSAKIFVWFSNRSLSKLSESLLGMGLPGSESAFSVVGKDHGLVVSGDRLAVLDLANARVLRTLNVRDLSVLKIYEDARGRMQFRLATRRGGQTRKLSTPSIIQMAQVFDVMTQRGIPIEYIQE